MASTEVNCVWKAVKRPSTSTRKHEIMHWLQSVELAEDGFLGTFFTLHKEVERAYIDSHNALNPRPSSYRTITAKLDLTKWNLVSAATYFPALTEEEAASTPHRVYQFHCAAVSVLVPAYVLMRAFHLSGNRKSLIFSPGDLQEYGFLDEIGEVFVFPQAQHARYEMAPPRCDRQLLRYLLAYPSGREFWASVYRNLSIGEIDVVLPRTILTIKARGYTRGAHFSVETFAIQTIEAMEEPATQHAMMPKVFHPNTNLGGRGRPIPSADLLTLIGLSEKRKVPATFGPRSHFEKPPDGEKRDLTAAFRPRSDFAKPRDNWRYGGAPVPAVPEITDSEWRQLRRLFRSFEEEAVSVGTLRWCVNSILYRELSGAAWSEFLWHWERPFVLSHYEAWVKSGVWTDIRKKLAEMRPATRPADW